MLIFILRSDAVAFKNPVPLVPAAVLPSALAERFFELFQKAGVPDQHPPEMFLSILAQMCKLSVLSDADADVVVELLRYLVREKHMPPVALSAQNRLLPVGELLVVDNIRLEVPVCVLLPNPPTHLCNVEGVRSSMTACAPYITKIALICKTLYLHIHCV